MDRSHLHLSVSGHEGLEPFTVALLATCALLVAVLLPAVPDRASPEWAYQRLQPARGPAPAITTVHDLAETDVIFSLGGYRGEQVVKLAMSREIDCRTFSEVAGAVPAWATGRLLFHRASGAYTYRWLTVAEWRGTCRRLQLKLGDGSSRVTVFRFVDRGGWVRDRPCRLIVAGSGSSPRGGPPLARVRSC